MAKDPERLKWDTSWIRVKNMRYGNEVERSLLLQRFSGQH